MESGFVNFKLMGKIVFGSLLFLALSGCQPTWPEAPDLADVKTICLDIHQAKSQMDQHWIFYDEEIERILSRMDYEFLEKGSQCDATLTLDGKGTPYGANYKSSSGTSTYCYTGGRVKGEIVYQEQGKEPLVYDISGTKPKATSDSISSCSKSAPYYEAIHLSLLEAFNSIWGPQFVVHNLLDEKTYIRDFSVSKVQSLSDGALPYMWDCLDSEDYFSASNCAYFIGSYQVSEEMLHELIMKLSEENAQTVSVAILALGAIGPEAAEATEPLINLLDDSRLSPHSDPIKELASEALEDITGEQYGLNQDAWLNWLKTQQ